MLSLRSRFSNTEDLFNFPQQFENLFVGFDRLMDDFSSVTQFPETKYPPYNLIKEDDNHYTVEMALAGFKLEDISITTNNGWLTISGETSTEKDTSKDELKETSRDYIYRGIASRKFNQSFKLYEHVMVTGADFDNGMLKIHLEHKLPEHLKEQKITISSSKK